jgi:hypothetical protein
VRIERHIELEEHDEAGWAGIGRTGVKRTAVGLAAIRRTCVGRTSVGRLLPAVAQASVE